MIAEGVPHFVLIGTVCAYGRARYVGNREDRPRSPHTFKGHMRKAQEGLLMAADSAGRIKATVLRLPDFYGPGTEKSFLHGAFTAAVAGRMADLIGSLDRPMNSYSFRAWDRSWRSSLP